MHHGPTPETKTAKPATPLPTDPRAAIQHLIRVSQSIMTLAEKETQALLLNDMMAFSILQYEKEKLAADYIHASAQFRNRLNEFRTMDRAFLNRLETLQKEIARTSASNNLLVERLYKRAQEAAQKSILESQKISNTKPVRFERNTPATEGAAS